MLDARQVANLLEHNSIRSIYNWNCSDSMFGLNFELSAVQKLSAQDRVGGVFVLIALDHKHQHQHQH